MFVDLLPCFGLLCFVLCVCVCVCVCLPLSLPSSFDHRPPGKLTQTAVVSAFVLALINVSQKELPFNIFHLGLRSCCISRVGGERGTITYWKHVFPGDLTFHLLKKLFYFPLLVLKGINHYRKICFFSRGLKPMQVRKCKKSSTLIPMDLRRRSGKPVVPVNRFQGFAGAAAA